MFGGTSSQSLFIAAFVATLTQGSIGHAQDATGGLNASLNVSQRINIADEDDADARTNLAFMLSSTTRRESLQFSANTGIEQRFSSGVDFAVTDPSVGLSYTNESKQSSLTTGITYRQSDTDTLVEDSRELSDVLVTDEGLRTDVNANATLTLGRDAPFGADFQLGYALTAFSETSDPDLIDTERLSAGVNLRFNIDPTITATLGYNTSDTNRDGGRDVENDRLTAGVSVAINPILDSTASIGLSRVQTSENGQTTQEDGVNYQFSLTQARPTGTITYALGSDISETGRRTTARVSAQFETQRGALSGAIGLTQDEDENVRPLFQLAYQDELPRGSYSISVNQDFATNGAGEEILNNRLQIGWQQELTPTVGVSSSLRFLNSENLDDDGDTSRLDLSVGFQKELANDWALNGTYRRSRLEDSNQITEWTDNLFLGVQKSFGWRR